MSFVLLDGGQLAGFLVAAVLITLAPGPDNLMVLSLGLSRGRRAGMIFGFGCGFGCLSHTALAAAGLSAAIAASATAFMTLKIAGGCYLLWLGVQSLRSRGTAGPSAEPAPANSTFVKGLVANAINPKVILFFLAFLPQFVEPGRGGIASQTLQLGLLFTIQAAILFGMIGWFSGHLGRRLGQSPKLSVWLDRVAGVVFVGIGLRLILAR